ncbi:hypothetical protein EDD16DRAFT_1711067 [Pisolithus croceorrhizus]|nr:hypothetical protein EDD16DRAFT_1711067 [Pisolithus croceorrhizus]KAI6119645.1 hypothetical protein EV401DRAFT_2071348 [Pisolithus croceorrhizus]KAI6160186.1 hypothetical protein EDD17DRAFT_840567 [Pisolithus thermaeus]
MSEVDNVVDVDQTSERAHTLQPRSSHQRSRASSPTIGLSPSPSVTRGRKRPRVDEAGQSAAAEGLSEEIVSVDNASVIAKITNRPAVSSTSSLPNSPEALSAYTCPHLLLSAHQRNTHPLWPCLFTVVKATVQRNMLTAMNGAPVPRCPVCRAEIPGWDGRGRGVIGLKLHVVYSL